MWHNTFYVVPLRLIFKLLTQNGKHLILIQRKDDLSDFFMIILLYYIILLSLRFGSCLSVTWNAWSINLDCFYLGGWWQLLHRFREAPWPSGQAIQGECHQVGGSCSGWGKWKKKLKRELWGLNIYSVYVLRHAKCVIWLFRKFLPH